MWRMKKRGESVMNLLLEFGLEQLGGKHRDRNTRAGAV